MNDSITTGDQQVRTGGRYLTYGVGSDSPIRSIWILIGRSHMILADLTIDAHALAPTGAADKATWVRANLDRFPEFMLNTFGLDDHFDDEDEIWDANGQLRFTAYADSYTPNLTERQAYDLVVAETRISEVKAVEAQLGDAYREWLRTAPAA